MSNILEKGLINIHGEKLEQVTVKQLAVYIAKLIKKSAYLDKSTSDIDSKPTGLGIMGLDVEKQQLEKS